METSRAEAERLLGIAEKLLKSKDFSGSRDFAILAQETEPLLDGSEQILAIAEVLLASENKRLNNNQPDWYSLLQIPQRTDELELIKKQYRRLALLLHPDKNKFPFSDSAFRLVADSWAVLSDPAKKSAYDSEFMSRFTKVDLKPQQSRQPRKQQQQQQQPKKDDSHQKLPVRRSGRGGGSSAAAPGGAGGAAAPSPAPSSGGIGANRTNISSNNNNNNNNNNINSFWTACPYCYNLYEYPRAYDGCCLRCDNENCKRAFTASEILSMPPVVEGRDAYYCCWGFFPMGFAAGDVDAGKVFSKWMPPMFGDGHTDPPVNATPVAAPPTPAAAAASTAAAAAAAAPANGKRGRGRPKKNL